MENEIVGIYFVECIFHAFALQEIPKSVYHYTSSDGLISILKEKKLWFSKIEFLNDEKERVYILDLYNDVCNELHKDGKLDDSFKNLITINKLNSKSTFPIKSNDDIQHYSYEDSDNYICCFSKDCDSLPMWHYYSKDITCGGYNLEYKFDKDLFLKLKKQYSYDIKWYNVIYDVNVQKKFLKEIICKCYEFYQKDSKLINRIKDGIQEVLTAYSWVFKSPHFMYENEFRIVISVPKKRDDKILYRTKNGCIIPYIEMEFDKKLIDRVTIGPLLNAEMAKDGLSFFLQKENYADTQIYKSNVSIRY